MSNIQQGMSNHEVGKRATRKSGYSLCQTGEGSHEDTKREGAQTPAP